VVLGGHERQLGAADGTGDLVDAEAVERLGAGDLVDEVQVDVQQIGVRWHNRPYYD
jgi:hypothetical protein